MFVRTLKDDVTIDGRTYPAGSVAAAHKARADELVRRKHAEPHPGPADAVPAPERAAAPETATARTQPERAAARR